VQSKSSPDRVIPTVHSPALPSEDKRPKERTVPNERSVGGPTPPQNEGGSGNVTLKIALKPFPLGRPVPKSEDDAGD
jgi:hypothetical protein